MSERDVIKEYVEETGLADPKDLVNAVRYCGALLGFWGLYTLKDDEITRFVGRSARKRAYISFGIPKKSGGVRHICAPVESLKRVQQALNLLLQSLCRVADEAMGFVPGRSVVTNADIHRGSSVIMNCDLKDFFTSISKQMVSRALQNELAPYRTSREVIGMMASLVTIPCDGGGEVLAQGAPTSPVVSNLVMKDLDHRLAKFAEKEGYRYSRYADDITFSRTDDYNPELPIKSEAILSIIAEAGFKINPKKTKVSTRAERMEVTGLTVGEKVNVSREYVKQLRVLLHLWEKRGFEEAQAIYTKDFNKGVEANLASVINGKINYLCMVKGRFDSTYRTLKRRYRTVTQQPVPVV